MTAIARVSTLSSVGGSKALPVLLSGSSQALPCAHDPVFSLSAVSHSANLCWCYPASGSGQSPYRDGRMVRIPPSWASSPKKGSLQDRVVGGFIVPGDLGQPQGGGEA